MDCNWRDKPLSIFSLRPGSVHLGGTHQPTETLWVKSENQGKEAIEEAIRGRHADRVIIDDPIESASSQVESDISDRYKRIHQKLQRAVEQADSPKYRRALDRFGDELRNKYNLGMSQPVADELITKMRDSFNAPFSVPVREPAPMYHFGGNDTPGSISFQWKGEISEETRNIINRLAEAKNTMATKFKHKSYVTGPSVLLDALIKVLAKEGYTPWNKKEPDDFENPYITVYPDGVYEVRDKDSVAFGDKSALNFSLPGGWDEAVRLLSEKNDIPPVIKFDGRRVEYKEAVFKVGCQEIGYSRLPAILDPIKSYNNDHEGHEITELVLKGEAGPVNVAISDLERINKHFNK